MSAPAEPHAWTGRRHPGRPCPGPGQGDPERRWSGTDRRTALADLVPAEDAAAHARTLLAPLAASPALIETLRTWLSLHGSWDRTAVALAVHRNTVRQRIGRCATLLGADLDDPDVRMELWFALRQE